MFISGARVQRVTSSKRANAGTKGVARPEREAQILAAACRTFGERGYAATSVADVAGAAGISKPLIYNYFGSKDGLHVACVRHASAELTEEIERTAHTATTGLARAVITLDGMFRRLESEPWLWRLVSDPSAPSDPELEREVATDEQRVLGFAREAVTELMQGSGDNDPVDVDLMLAVWESVFRTLVNWWVDHPGDSPEEMTQRCVRLIAAASTSATG
jgi:AcrR family transcriptional regulator